MPPRRRAAAAAAAAAPAASQPLDGLTIAVSGKFDDVGHSHGSLESLVVSLGGGFSRSVTAKTTHVICTEYDFKAGSSKINSAKAKDLKIVSPEWLIEADSKQAKPDEEDYSWEDKKPAAPKKNGTTKATTTVASKKRAVAANTDDEADADADDEPKTKKAKAAPKAASKAAPKAAPKTAPTAAPKAPTAKATKAAKGSKAKGKAAVKDESEPEPEPEETKEEKVVADGQFIKKKGVTIPVDEYCPLVNYVVFVDPDTGMIYDASLNQSNSSNNNNKFYRIQVSFPCPRSSFSLMFHRFYWRISPKPTRLGLGGAVLVKQDKRLFWVMVLFPTPSIISRRSSRTSLATHGKTEEKTPNPRSMLLSSEATTPTRMMKTMKTSRQSRRRARKRLHLRNALLRSLSRNSWSSFSISSTSRPP